MINSLRDQSRIDRLQQGPERPDFRKTKRRKLSFAATWVLWLAAATLSLGQPVITSQPQWQTNFIGGTATFSVWATGAPPLLYQWRKVAASLPGQTNSTLVLTNLQLSQQALYSVVVSNVEGSVTSSAARLYVVRSPTITPANPTASLFADVMFDATNTSGAPQTYQWLFNGAPITGAVTNSLSVTNVQKTNAGDYALLVTYSFGSATSSVARLAITPFVVQPTNATASLFADVTFSSTLAPAHPVLYQWLFNGMPTAGALTDTLTVTNVQKTNAGEYTLVATYSSVSATSAVARLTITPYNSIYWFGFSWTDTHNPGLSDPIMYYHNRACNGPMWPEFLSTNLGLPYVERNNYAIGGSDASDMLAQARTFPIPPKPQLSLYFFWVNYGAIPTTVTNFSTWDQLLQSEMVNASNVVSTLYLKGARQIVIQDSVDIATFPFLLPPFFPVVHIFGTNAAGLAKFSELFARLNATFRDVMKVFGQAKPDVRIIWMDSVTNLNEVIASPGQYGFTKATVPAINDPALTNLGPVSFSGPGADYVFWDAVHGTSKLHKLITAWTLDKLTNCVLETLDVAIVGGSPDIQMNHLLIGRDYTLQKSTDLSHWSDVHSFTAAAGTNQVTQATAGEPTLFYRLRWRP